MVAEVKEDGVLARQGRGRKSQQAIVAIDPKGKIVRANARAKRLLSDVEDSPEGRDFGQFLASSVLSAGHSAEVHSVGLGKEYLLLVLSQVEARQREGEGQRPAPAPAQPADQSRTAPLADFMAHELRNPLNTIRGIASILRESGDTAAAESRRLGLDTIGAEAERAFLIIHSLLLLAEGRHAGQRELVPVPLHSLVRQAIDNHQRTHPTRRFRVDGDEPLYALGVQQWLDCALGNLISNAEKYTPQDQPIEIRLSQNGGWSSVLVMDRGQTLSPGVYASLWDVYGGSARPEVRVTGSGIGLHLCRMLVEEMQGRVWAGPREGAGSVFAMSLPCTSDAALDEVA